MQTRAHTEKTQKEKVYQSISLPGYFNDEAIMLERMNGMQESELQCISKHHDERRIMLKYQCNHGNMPIHKHVLIEIHCAVHIFMALTSLGTTVIG